MCRYQTCQTAGTENLRDFEKGCPIDLKIIEKIEPGDSYNQKKGNNEIGQCPQNAGKFLLPTSLTKRKTGAYLNR